MDLEAMAMISSKVRIGCLHIYASTLFNFCNRKIIENHSLDEGLISCFSKDVDTTVILTNMKVIQTRFVGIIFPILLGG